MGAAENTDQPLLDRSYAGITATLNRARCDLSATLVAHGLDDPSYGAVVADAELVLSELISNAIDASPDCHYRVTATLGPEHVHISVTNSSAAVLPDESDWQPPDVLALRGRGLSIVKALSDTVQIISTGAEVTVVVQLRTHTA